MLEDRARELGLEMDLRESDHEGHLVDWLHEAQATGAKAVLLNAGALHTTPASPCTMPSRRYRHAGDRSPPLQTRTRARTFRHKSYVGMAAEATIRGLRRAELSALPLRVPRSSDQNLPYAKDEELGRDAGSEWIV